MYLSCSPFRSGAAVCDGKLYVIGGCTGSSGLKNGLVYDPSTNKWEYIPRMQQGRLTLELNPCTHHLA